MNDLQPTAVRRNSRWPWFLVVVAIVLAIGVYFVRVKRKSANASPANPSASAPDRVVPVQVTTVRAVDVPIILEGVGNVIPIATVIVRTQVDGRLEKVLFKEGEHVKAGQVLAQIDPRPFQIQLQQGQASLAKDRATVDNARLDLDRYTTLRAQNLVPQQQVDTQRTLVNQTNAAILSDEAQINSAKLNLDYSRVISPISGVTGVRLVDPGNIVHAADTTGIVVVTQLDPIAVLFVLPEDDQFRVSQAMARGPLTVDAYNRDGSKKLVSGRLLLIDNQISTTTATIRLKATFDNPDNVLWPNAFVKARLTLDVRNGVLTVPNSVLQSGPKGSFVYVLKPNQTVDVRPVEVDMVQGDTAILRSGLAAGETVVIEGQNQLRPGAKVAVRPGSSERPATTSPSASPPSDRQPRQQRSGAKGAPIASEAPVPGLPNTPDKHQRTPK